MLRLTTELVRRHTQLARLCDVSLLTTEAVQYVKMKILMLVFSQVLVFKFWLIKFTACKMLNYLNANANGSIIVFLSGSLRVGRITCLSFAYHLPSHKYN